MSKLTNFQKVGEFHRVFGHPKNEKPQFNIFDDDKKLVKLRIDLIQEELDELKEACEEKDMTEVADALCDILYVTYGAGHAFGLDLDTMFNEVQESNMSKTCDNEEDAKISVKKYQEEKRYKDPKYRKSDCDKYWIVYDNKTGKILKNHKFKSPELSKFLV